MNCYMKSFTGYPGKEQIALLVICFIMETFPFLSPGDYTMQAESYDLANRDAPPTFRRTSAGRVTVHQATPSTDKTHIRLEVTK